MLFNLFGVQRKGWRV